MTIKPEEILDYEFSRSFRGYSEAEVNEFLEELAEQWEELLQGRDSIFQEREDLKKKLADRHHYVQKLEGNLEDWKMQVEVEKELARREGQVLLREAQSKSQRIVEEALRKKREIETDYTELQEKYTTFLSRFKSLMNTFMQNMERKEGEFSGFLETRPLHSGTPKSRQESIPTKDSFDSIPGDDVTSFSLDDFRDDAGRSD